MKDSAHPVYYKDECLDRHDYSLACSTSQKKVHNCEENASFLLLLLINFANLWLILKKLWWYKG